MFVNAIERSAAFTRPIHTIVRYWDSTTVTPAAATLFFVNNNGWALTCRHVAELLAATVGERYRQFKVERDALPQRGDKKRMLRELVNKYRFTNTTPINLQNRFINCIEGPLNLDCHPHPTEDVALLHFQNYTTLLCTSFPTFGQDAASLKQGRSICRLGFPFPEFTNFEYDVTRDDIGWTATGRQNTPRFPIDGMLTRHLLNAQGDTVGFELSTPGLRGQSGGPAFDVDGRIWGMQASTAHLDLDFDVDKEVLRSGRKRRVNESAFLHVGHCVHVDVLKQFMTLNNVAFQQG